MRPNRQCLLGAHKSLLWPRLHAFEALIYEKLPADIASRHVLLLDPVLASGNSAVKAISLLLSKGVPESNIIFLNLIAVSHSSLYSVAEVSFLSCLWNSSFEIQAPEGIHAVCKMFPRLKIVTSEIDVSLNKDLRVLPGMGEFGDRYFGTDNGCATLKHQPKDT
ncbi:unnamed protein product [Ilex paraguariensis]|uniref:Phosphoribosyltransferase domain-containing protein n=1 Tax=Ilex paraguariensis TaxID=185542 RepID=A0ABC8UHB8_9AQUA